MAKKKYYYEEYRFLENVSGIYLFENIITGKKYIGRSNDIYRRIGEHLRCSFNPNDKAYNDHFHRALRKYPLNQWKISCIYVSDDQKELVEKERMYILQYDSVKYGYNSTYETNSPDTSHVKRILSDDEIWDIREAYANHKDKMEIFDLYKYKIAWSTFGKIWTGFSCKNIHYDVYTPENKKYHEERHNEKNKEIKYTHDMFKDIRECVYDIRKLYAEEVLSYKEVYSRYPFLNENSFKDVWYGKTFADIVPDGYLEVKERGRKKIHIGNGKGGKPKLRTQIQRITADWTEVKNECRNTTNKDATDTPATADFVRKILISEHSPIRLVKVKYRWEGIKSWISVHFARHWLGFDKWISTQRTDRTGVDRDSAPQDAPVNMDVEANAQALINVARYRLCNQAASETRKYMVDLKFSIKDAGQKELSDVLVPNCIYRCGCPEFTPCPFFEKVFMKEAINRGINYYNIVERYNLYNEILENTEGSLYKREKNRTRECE